MTIRRKQALWTVVAYLGVTIGLTLTFWIDPLHDGWSKQVLYYGPTLGIMTIAVTELFFFYQKMLFGRDVLSEWFDRHVGTWSDSPRSRPPKFAGSPHERPKFTKEKDSQESQADELANVR
jgi:hypothetical protein